MDAARYAPFGALCFAYALAVLWLVFRRRITLQASLVFLLLLVALGLTFVVLHFAPGVTAFLGFTLPSNLIFSVSLAVLALLHLMHLVSLSRVELRSVTLIQEVALLQEELERLRGEIAAVRACDQQPPVPLPSQSEPR